GAFQAMKLAGILRNAILRRLSEGVRAEYRRPFAEPGGGRRPTLTWPIATEYADWLGTSTVTAASGSAKTAPAASTVDALSMSRLESLLSRMSVLTPVDWMRPHI